MLIKFTDYSVADKMRIMLEGHDVNNIYQLIAKSTRSPEESIHKLFDIQFHHIRQRIFIRGNESDLCRLLLHLSNLGVEFESVTSECLRIDLGMFLSKVK